jgi:pescadillo protein
VISDLSEKIASMADVEDSDDEDVEQAELKEAAIGIESVVVDGEEVAEDESKNEVPTISELEARTLSASAFTTLFSDCKIWLSREVPIHSVAFAIKSFGGSVSWIDNVGTFPANDPSITHHIIDRPAGMEDWKLEYGDTRDYVQPQWVFDCINAKRILPTTGYHAGEILPPHLSPFEVYEEGDYVPEAAESAFSASRGGSGEGMVGDVEVLDVNDVDVKIAEEDDDEPHGGPEDDDIEEVDSDEEMYQSELKAEAAGLSYSEYMQKKIEKEAGGKRKSVAAAATPSKKSKASADADEKKELSKMMMGKKDKRLYEQIQFGKDKKAVKVAALTKKRDDAKVSKGKKSGWNVVER